MMDRITRIRERLTAALTPTSLNINDDSAHHIRHACAKSCGHFTVTIASPLFEGKSLVQQHQLIYQALGDMMQHDIHALAIKVLP